MTTNFEPNPLVELYEAARKAEASAVSNLLAALQSTPMNGHAIDTLTNRMTVAHNHAMDILDQLKLRALGQ